MNKRRNPLAGWRIGMRSSGFDFEDHLDFDRNIPGKHRHSHRTAGPDSVFRTPDLAKEFAATVDDFRMFGELRRAVDHPKRFNHALYFVETSDVFAECRENGQTYLSGGRFPL